MMGLTQKQRELLAFLRRKASGGEMPSFQEMANHLGLRSRSGISRLLAGLEERGHIRRLPNRARSIEVVEVNELARFSTSELMRELSHRAKVA